MATRSILSFYSIAEVQLLVEEFENLAVRTLEECVHSALGMFSFEKHICTGMMTLEHLDESTHDFRVELRA